ncbi:pyridoxal phosphate-dependent aminotransferase [Bradyrhizobium sp. LTSP857]|uniref:pyridoxal phosphate-dependent aminotransferase n=1 Tax=Bradyrhizobium sp. LTSP857 TaxID=1619231 RepID=UPI0009E5FF74|nr:pyridoxal phosphate-dependent aminotransferase [Bradyrhizobium sp. LTSP857]
MIQEVDFTALGEDAVGRLPYSSTRLGLYERLIQYFAAVSTAGGEYLDMINFHRDVYPPVVSLPESESLFAPEHGYASPDGLPEVGQLIREYERVRADRFAHQLGRSVKPSFETMGVGIGAGTTGVMNCLLPAIRDVSNQEAPCIALTIPLYSVYDGISREHGLQPIYLQTRREASFLPTAAQVASILEKRPIALILTYPSNPAQTTYGPSRFDDLKAIIELCQQSKTFLIVDNIYQDTLWSDGAVNPEVFALTDSDRFVVKVSGPSKDRPGCSGWRIGHWIGDSVLQERYFYYVSIQYNTPNSASRCALALDLLCRLAQLRGRLERSDMDLLGGDIAGWNRPINRDRLYSEILNNRLSWNLRLGQIETIQKNALNLLKHIALSSDAFSEVVNDDIGNVLLVRAAPKYFGGTDHELFISLMNATGIGILPANAFGFPPTSGDAWFRITTIHQEPERIADQLSRVAAALKSGLS